ncbi:MAG: hypothetical protein K8S20_14785 [Chloroflexi bacterium]|nr:hypothetical protein [Chloroflexota bacterium]
MKNAPQTTKVVIRVKLNIPTYIRDNQLPELMAHVEDVITTIDGLYTQMSMVSMGEAKEAYIYDEAALSFLEEYYYTAANKLSLDRNQDEQSIVAFDQYPFTSLANPLLEFSRIILLKYPNSPPPLALSAIKTGSIVVDLLGIGKILDFIEHIVKQLQWESKHQREMADSGKRTAFLEEQLLNQKLIASMVDNEEKKLITANRKIELIRNIQELDLPQRQKRKLVRSIIDKADLVSAMAEIRVIRKR